MTCLNCGNKTLESLISSTNYVYEFCSSYNVELDKINKSILIDEILKNIIKEANIIKNTLNTINVKKENNLLKLYINNKSIHEIEFSYYLSEKDKYFLNNTISDILQDTWYVNVESLSISID